MVVALFIALFALPQQALAKTKEAYVFKSFRENTLTFYYDAHKMKRHGIKWDINEVQMINGYSYPAWTAIFLNPNTTINQAVIDPSFKDFRPTTTSKWFSFLTALTQITGMENLNTSEVTDMSRMFDGCSALTKINVTKFDTKNVTDMSSMFSGCKALTQLNITKFDTKNVTDMSEMFHYCSKLTTIYCNDTWTCNKSNKIFAACPKLKGAVSYDESKTNVAMANPNTGYFTKKTNDNREAYVVKTNNGKTLTFYYDTQKATRPGTKWGINETQMDDGSTYPAWSGTYPNPNKTTTQAVITPSFKDFRPTTTAKWFYKLEALTQITGMENLNTEEVTDMSSMFDGCKVLTQLNVTKFDTKKVTNMSYMFYDCSALTKLDVSKFDTKNVTKMSGMFYDCSVLTKLDVSKFDTKNVTDMNAMFAGCKALTQLDVSKFDTKNVTHMSYMFSDCKALTQLDVTKFDTKNVTNMSNMFSGCEALSQLDVTKFDTKKVTDMSYMFFNCSTLTQLNVTKFDTKNVTDMNAMFYNCSALTQLDVTKFDTKNVTDMRNMFSGCEALSQLDVTKFDTKKVTDMSYMFFNCPALTQLDVTKFDTKNVTNMRNMFNSCSGLTQLDVTKFDTKKVTDMNEMFYSCSALTQLDVTKFDTKNVTKMSHMFFGCSALTQLDVTKFDTKNVTDMQLMFHGCFALTTIYCNDTWTCGNSKDMFVACPKLKGAASYDESKTDVAMANPNTGYFTKKGSAGIAQTSHAATIKAIYSIDGRRLKEIQPGVNIVKMSDGTTRKIIKK